MISADNNQLLLSGKLTTETVPAIFREGIHYLVKQDWQIDLSQVEAVDSSAVSLLLGWLRQAKAKQRQIYFCNLPPDLLSLAQLYGVDEMLTTQ